MNRLKHWLFKVFDITSGDDCVESVVLDLEPMIWQTASDRLHEMSLAESRGYLRARFSVVIRSALADRFGYASYSHSLDKYLDLVVRRLHERVAVAVIEAPSISRKAA